MTAAHHCKLRPKAAGGDLFIRYRLPGGILFR